MNGAGGFRRRRRGQGAAGRPSPAMDAPTGAAVTPAVGMGDHKRSLMETALLITLLEESGHGYALTERVQQLVGNGVYVDPGSVYRILRLLEEAGMVSSTWEAGVAGPQRRTYTVEPAGRELLRSWAGIHEKRGKALLELARLARERVD